MFEGWIALEDNYKKAWCIVPKAYWEERGRLMDGHPGGPIPGFSNERYVLKALPETKHPKKALKELGFEVR
jgi:hypothetical protein